MSSDLEIDWKLGVELELLAPRGSSRRALAERLARGAGGEVRPFFHAQSEPSLVPDVPTFENLTLGFAALDSRGNVVATCVDDITLQNDLERELPPAPGWFRIVSDDSRLLNLVKRSGRADAGLREALQPVAALFGTEPEALEHGALRVTDESRAPVAIGMPLPGERERPCELVSPPLEKDHQARLEALLSQARELGFGLAQESATHLHFDAEALCSARAVLNLVRLLSTWGLVLKDMVGTNPACRRLGKWPAELRQVVEGKDFAELSWPEARARLENVPLTKYCDFNLRNFVHQVAEKHTFEVRILPGLIHGRDVMRSAALFEAVLRLATGPRLVDAAPPRRPGQRSTGALLELLPLSEMARRAWLSPPVELAQTASPKDSPVLAHSLTP